jgi:hypothetical protein
MMRAVLVVLALLIVQMSPSTQAKTSLSGTLGGGGGTPFSSYCGPNAYLTSIDVRSGAWIDGIYARCGVLGADALSFVSGTYPSYVGGTGGGPATVSLGCPNNNQVVSWLEVEVVRRGGATYVSNLWIDCLRIVPPGDRPGSTGPRRGENLADASYERAGFLKCPEGRWAVGLYGTAGIYIDSIGLICDTAPGVVDQLIEVQPCAFCKKQVFAAPTINGTAVDLCLNWGTGCGAPAADEFCRRQGFSASTEHTVQNDAPPTLVLGDNLVCDGAFCDRFSAITCR